MGDYAPPFTITNKILTYVSSISEKIGRITATSSLESKPHLRRNNRIKSIHSSLKIGSQLPFFRTSPGCNRGKNSSWKTNRNTGSKKRIRSL